MLLSIRNSWSKVDTEKDDFFYRLMRLPEAARNLKNIIHLPNYILLKSINIIELCCWLDNAKTYTCFTATIGQYHRNTVEWTISLKISIKKFILGQRIICVMIRCTQR